MIRTAASLTALTVVFALVLYLSYSCGNDGDGSPSPTANPSPVVEHPTPTTTPPRPSPTSQPKFASQILFPEDTALILGTGCWQCDGPTTGLRRIYRDPSGSIRIDQILSVDRLGIERRDDRGKPYVTGLAISPDGTDMMVSLCIEDSCANGGLGIWGPNSAVVIVRSTDGGVTWDIVGEFEGGIHLLGLIDDGVAYGYWYERSAEDPSVQPSFALFPTLDPIAPPADDFWPVAAVDGQIVWTPQSQEGSPQYSDGSEFPNLPDDADATIAVFDPYTRGDDVPVIWSSRNGGYFLSLVTSDGNANQTVALPSNLGSVIADGLGSVYTNVSVIAPESGVDLPAQFSGQLPALVDMKTGTIHPISDHLQPDERNARDTLFAVQTGPFARVDDTRSCLNLRTSPGLEATKVACLADGVLLRHDSVAVTNQDVEWLQVTAPDGTQGWAATEFLEW
ncbi:MAG: SH3 domain-containing protein [Chloroflexi bacterium]|nr:SH3 domain-containing protein [Chloroflexota bacterium]